nr:DUF3473 domain-containing protein [Pyrinomonadaceae bacterium]
MSEIHSSSTKRHLLTVLLEDYFHVGAFNGLIERANWYRFETRFESNTLKTLDLLDRFDIKATFFVLGWIADRQPQLVREVAARGHEIASRGYYHRSLRHLTPQEFREDLARSREALERASGTEVIGYRAPRRLFLPSDSWALDVLAEEGYAYDSSVVPTFRSARANRVAYKHHYAGKEIWEFPVATCNVLGWPVPIAGGNFSRQIPHTLLKHLVDRWHRTSPAPFVMYFHVWELDPEQPRINGAPMLAKLRHYRKLDKMAWVLDDYFSKYRFVGVADYLGLSTGRNPAQATRAEHAFASRPASEVASEATVPQPRTRASLE